MHFNLQFAEHLASLVVAAAALTKGGAALYRMSRESQARRAAHIAALRGQFSQDALRRSLDYYIRPRVSDHDPAHFDEPSLAVRLPQEDLFDKMDTLLALPTGRVMLVLADSGMGKTSFVTNYFVHRMARRRHPDRCLAIVSLAGPDADKYIHKLARRGDAGQLAVFLDAFDEDRLAIRDRPRRLTDILEHCSTFKNVVITSRSQFFVGPDELNLEAHPRCSVARPAGQPAAPDLLVYYLMPFSDSDVAAYLRRRFPFPALRLRKRAMQIVLRAPLLSVRPMLLAYIPDLLHIQREPATSYAAYDELVRAWILREKGWIARDTLVQISEKLAVDLVRKRGTRGGEWVEMEELAGLVRQWGCEVPEWQLRARSLLNRGEDKRVRFAHRSIMEYLFVKCLMRGDVACTECALTDQMKSFLAEAVFGNGESGRWLKRLLLRCDVEVVVSVSSGRVEDMRRIGIAAEAQETWNTLLEYCLEPDCEAMVASVARIAAAVAGLAGAAERLRLLASKGGLLIDRAIGLMEIGDCPDSREGRDARRDFYAIEDEVRRVLRRIEQGLEEESTWRRAAEAAWAAPRGYARAEFQKSWCSGAEGDWNMGGAAATEDVSAEAEESVWRARSEVKRLLGHRSMIDIDWAVTRIVFAGLKDIPRRISTALDRVASAESLLAQHRERLSLYSTIAQYGVGEMRAAAAVNQGGAYRLAARNIVRRDLVLFRMIGG